MPAKTSLARPLEFVDIRVLGDKGVSFARIWRRVPIWNARQILPLNETGYASRVIQTE